MIEPMTIRYTLTLKEYLEAVLIFEQQRKPKTLMNSLYDCALIFFGVILIIWGAAALGLLSFIIGAVFYFRLDKRIIAVVRYYRFFRNKSEQILLTQQGVTYSINASSIQLAWTDFERYFMTPYAFVLVYKNLVHYLVIPKKVLTAEERTQFQAFWLPKIPEQLVPIQADLPI